MSVSVSSNIVYTIKDSNHPSESFDVIGLNGLDKHYENCLGGFIDKMYSESIAGNVFKDKQRIYDFLEKNKTQLLTILELSAIIAELKTENEF